MSLYRPGPTQDAPADDQRAPGDEAAGRMVELIGLFRKNMGTRQSAHSSVRDAA